MWGGRFPHPISDDGAAPAERAVRYWQILLQKSATPSKCATIESNEHAV